VSFIDEKSSNNLKVELNKILNSNNPMTLLDVALKVKTLRPSSMANSVAILLKAKGALSYEELKTFTPKKPTAMIPRNKSRKNKSNKSIKKLGIAGVGSTRRNINLKKN
jgi:hypothetical protein